MKAAKFLGLSIALYLGLMPVSQAQSSFTTGTVASGARAGYGSGHGRGRLFAYAPGYRRAHENHSR
jgi:hypothetical protein